MPALPPTSDQVERLVELGVAALAGRTVAQLRAEAADLPAEGGLVVVHPALVPASGLTPLLSRGSRPGFVVVDLADLDEFVPVEGVEVPDRPLYLVRDLDRGDDLRSWSPDEAMPEIVRRGRTPLTTSEGICWLLQQPERLEPNHCFMTIASRKPKATGRGLDARTPAIWIGGGTGRDARDSKGAPKVGWCWAGNRHTWLGFAHAEERVA